MKHLTLKAGFKEQQQQEKLRLEHGLEKEVVVVERKSRIVMIWRTTLIFLFTALRILSMVIIAMLAMTGLTTLLFPEIRTLFLHTLSIALNEIFAYLP